MIKPRLIVFILLKRFLFNRRQLPKIELWESDLVGLYCNGKGSIPIRVKGERWVSNERTRH